jgi:hypothetical protein
LLIHDCRSPIQGNIGMYRRGFRASGTFNQLTMLKYTWPSLLTSPVALDMIDRHEGIVRSRPVAHSFPSLQYCPEVVRSDERYIPTDTLMMNLFCSSLVNPLPACCLSIEAGWYRCSLSLHLPFSSRCRSSLKVDRALQGVKSSLDAIHPDPQGVPQPLQPKWPIAPPSLDAW